MSRRRKTIFQRKPVLYIDDILRWADAYHDKWGRWPVARTSGRVPGQGGLTWMAIDMALANGLRGLPGGTTLAKLLVQHRGHRHHFQTPRLTVRLILKWADAHKKRTGEWPTKLSGPIVDAPGETWSGVDAALHAASRGIHKKNSLARILARYRGRQHTHELPQLKLDQILEWARAWRVLFGQWPSKNSGPIGNTGETWLRVDSALRCGLRGLAGGSSLSRFIREKG